MRVVISGWNNDIENQTNLVFFKFLIVFELELINLLSMITLPGLQIILAKSMYLNADLFAVEHDVFVSLEISESKPTDFCCSFKERALIWLELVLSVVESSVFC